MIHGGVEDGRLTIAEKTQVWLSNHAPHFVEEWELFLFCCMKVHKNQTS